MLIQQVSIIGKKIHKFFIKKSINSINFFPLLNKQMSKRGSSSARNCSKQEGSRERNSGGEITNLSDDLNRSKFQKEEHRWNGVQGTRASWLRIRGNGGHPGERQKLQRMNIPWMGACAMRRYRSARWLPPYPIRHRPPPVRTVVKRGCKATFRVTILWELFRKLRLDVSYLRHPAKLTEGTPPRFLSPSPRVSPPPQPRRRIEAKLLLLLHVVEKGTGVEEVGGERVSTVPCTWRWRR